MGRHLAAEKLLRLIFRHLALGAEHLAAQIPSNRSVRLSHKISPAEVGRISAARRTPAVSYAALPIAPLPMIF